MMSEIYGLIIAGATLFFGLSPILSAKLRGDNFLITYVRPDSYGEEEKMWEYNTPGADAGEHLKPSPNSEVKIVTYNFPKQEYEDPEWVDKLENWHKNGVKIKIVGGPDIEAKRAISDLIERGIIEVRRIKKPKTYHIAIASPPQLWIEENHKNKDAEDVTFTPKPYEWAWNKANRYFDKLWAAGKVVGN